MMFKKHDNVKYVARAGRGSTIRARVLTAHRDGSCTVKALFVQDDDGNDVPAFLGYKYRIDAADLQLAG